MKKTLGKIILVLGVVLLIIQVMTIFNYGIQEDVAYLNYVMKDFSITGLLGFLAFTFGKYLIGLLGIGGIFVGKNLTKG